MPEHVQYKWSWLMQEHALTPMAAYATGEVIDALLATLKSRELIHLENLYITVANDIVIILGDKNDLPWVNGVRYAACSKQDPRLWLPTHLQPSIPLEWLADKLCLQYEREPLFICPELNAIIPLNKQFPLTHQLLHSLQADLKEIETS